MTTATIATAPVPPALSLRAPVRSMFSSALDFLRLMLLLPALAASAVLLRRSSRQDDSDHAWSESSRLWAPTEPGLELSVVIPFYNPGDSMRPTVQRLVGLLRDQHVAFEVIAVSDGSTDGSERSLDGIGGEVRVLVMPRNRGKGAALHTGFAHAGGAYVGFVDCDGDIDPEHLVQYLAVARDGSREVVYASKRHQGAASDSSAVRKVISRGFSTIVSLLFALGVSDTQTGCKLFRRDVLADVLPRLRERRFAFDLEFFVAAKAAGYRDLVAAPVVLGERLAGSTVTRTTILRTLGDALTVFGRLHLSGIYAGRGLAPATRPTPAVTRLGTFGLADREAFTEAA